MAAVNTRFGFSAVLKGPVPAAVILGLAGFAGNWFRLPLFLNIDLLFGGFFVMLALLRHGTGAGIVASIIASSCTWLIWKHPYSMAIFIAEAAIVGLLNSRRNRSDLLLHDIFFWIVCGAPLVWLFYHFRMGDSSASTYLIMVKQALNGITNSLLASIFHLAALSRNKATERPTLRQTVFITMVSLVLFSACLHVFRELRSMKAREDGKLAERTRQATEMTRAFMSRWEMRRLPEALQLDELQRDLQMISGGKSMRIIVLDQSGQVVTSSEREPAIMTRHLPSQGGSLQKVAPAVDHWIPPRAEGKNLNQRWASSLFLSEAEISAHTRWKVVVEASYSPVIAELHREASASLTQLFLLSIIIIPISLFISFRLTRSLDALRQATLSLPGDVQQNLIPEFPDSNIQDIHGLMTNFKSAVLALQAQHQTLIGLNRELADMSRERLRAEERYRTLVEMSPEAVIVQQNGCIVFTNRAALYLLGADQGEQLYGSRMTDYLHPADRKIFEEHLQHTAAGEALSRLELRGQSLDGHEIVMEYAGVPVTFNDRPAVQAILRDITERKQFEDQIRKGKEEWECTFDSVPDLIAIMDNRHRIIRVNRPMAERLGRSPEQCIGLTCYETIHDTSCPPWFCPHSKTLNDGRMHEVEIEAQNFGGDFLVTTSPLFDVNGEVYASVHMARDISVLKQARKIAEKSAAELESIFAAIQDAIVIYDTEMNVIKVNSRFIASYGFDPVGLNLSDIVRRTGYRRLDGQQFAFKDQPTPRALRGETVLNQQFLITLDDGSEIALEASSMPLRLDDNTIMGVVTVWHDISDALRNQRELLEKDERLQKAHDALEVEVAERTKDLVRTIDSLQVEMSERLKAEEELRTRERLLIQQSRLAAMGEMISNVAHQWRQPLNTLGLIVQRLPHFYAAGKFDGDFLATNTRDAMNLIHHMSDTIDDFRDFFRPDKERTVFNVKKAVYQAISLIDTGFHSLNIDLETRIDGEPTINGYPSQFAQVILNILFNARDALLERGVSRGRITIEGNCHNKRVVLTIRDNAGGIPDDIIEKVFDPYFTTKGPDRGTGIGLFMAKSIIEKSMHGRITACNREDGAEFRIEV